MDLIEEYRDIKGYEGLYQVSNLGNVFSLISNKILKPHITNAGYYKVTLCNNTIKQQYLLHRLVAETFLENPDNLPCINHKDECKTNNVVSNLEFCTYSYNSNYGTGIQRMKEKRSISILQYDKFVNFIKEWKSITDAMKFVNPTYNKQTGCSFISKVCKGKTKSAYGYVWRYK